MANYFKYKSLSGTSFKHFVEMLLDESIYAATFDQLNDPMEGVFLSDKKLSSEIEKSYNDKKLERRIVSLVKKQHDESPNDILMWSHYSDGHKGCCIEFCFKNIEDEDKVKSISYINSLTEVHTENVCIDLLLMSKLKNWKKEQEYRYLGSKKYIPIKIVKIYLGMKIDNLYDNDDNLNEKFYRNLIGRLLPNVQVEVMKAENFICSDTRMDYKTPIIKL